MNTLPSSVPAFAARRGTGVQLIDIMLGGGLPVGRLVGLRGDDAAAVRALPWQVLEYAMQWPQQCAVVRVDDDAEPPIPIWGAHWSLRGPAVATQHPTNDIRASLTTAHVGGGDAGEILAAASALVTDDLSVLVIDGMPAPKVWGAAIPEDRVTELLRQLEACEVACLYTVREPRLGRRIARVLAASSARHLRRRTTFHIDLARCPRLQRGGHSKGTYVRARIDERGLGEPPLMATLELGDTGRLTGGRLRAGAIVEIGIRSGVIEQGRYGWLSFEGERLGANAKAAVLRLGDDKALASAIQDRIVAQDTIPF